MTLLEPETYETFREVGRDLFLAGLVTARSGNLSVRRGDRILITRSGSMLSRLAPRDVLETGIDAGPDDEGCSRELVVHRAIYRATAARAICHAHPPHTMYRSMVDDEIRPIDSEARAVIADAVPVLAPERKIASPEAAVMLAEALKSVPVAVLRTHGPFAVGETLWDAWGLVGVLEDSCRILNLRDAGGLPLR